MKKSHKIKRYSKTTTFNLRKKKFQNFNNKVLLRFALNLKILKLIMERNDHKSNNNIGKEIKILTLHHHQAVTVAKSDQINDKS